MIVLVHLFSIDSLASMTLSGKIQSVSKDSVSEILLTPNMKFQNEGKPVNVYLGRDKSGGQKLTIMNISGSIETPYLTSRCDIIEDKESLGRLTVSDSGAQQLGSERRGVIGAISEREMRASCTNLETQAETLIYLVQRKKNGFLLMKDAVTREYELILLQSK